MQAADLIYPPTVPGVQDKQLVEVVKGAGFRRFSKALMSECRKAQLTGICLQPAAVEAIRTTYPETRTGDPTVPDALESRRTQKKDGHRFTRRAGCRLSESVLTELNAYIQIDGTYQFVSELVEALLMDWLERKRNLRRTK